MEFYNVLTSIETMTKGELRTLNTRVRARYAVLEASAKASFYKGCYIRFTDKYGNPVHATVDKVCSRNLKATSTTGMKWTVNPGLATKVDDLPEW